MAGFDRVVSRNAQGVSLNVWDVPDGDLDRDFCDNFAMPAVALETLNLGVVDRLQIGNPQKAGDLQSDAENLLMSLFQDNETREKVRSTVYDAFGLYLVVDPTDLGNLRIRMSRRPPNDDIEEQGLTDRARAFHKDAIELDKLSEGVRAFTGITLALLVLAPRIILLDEPEAFLHPPLARRLGQIFAEVASSRQRHHIFVATHSADFVLGALQGSSSPQIIRLTFDSRTNNATGQILPTERLDELTVDPLLRSSNVLSGLFHKSVVVCEGDGDRAFYQEINDRLQRGPNPRGAKDCLFVNAYGWQNEYRAIRLLRSLGIPAASVVDLDVVKEGPLPKLLDAAGVPAAIKASFTALRGKVKEAFARAGFGDKMGRRVGIHNLAADDRESAYKLVDDLAEYGVFLVPGGSVESWLSELNVPGERNLWLKNMFQAMGPTTAQPAVPAGPSSVWAFIDRAAGWLDNAERKGMRN